MPKEDPNQGGVSIERTKTHLDEADKLSAKAELEKTREAHLAAADAFKNIYYSHIAGGDKAIPLYKRAKRGMQHHAAKAAMGD